MKKTGNYKGIRFLLSITGIILLAAALLLLFYEVYRSGKVTDDRQDLVEAKHHVLFLGSYGPTYFTNEEQLEGLSRGLYPHGIEYDPVYMESKLFASDVDLDAFREMLTVRLKNGTRDYEAVIAGDDAALSFVLDNRETLFSGLPVVFFGANDEALARRAVARQGVAGFYEDNYLDDTLKVAMDVFPDRKTLVAVHDNSAAGLADRNAMERDSAFLDGYSFMDLNTQEMSHERLVETLRNLPSDAIVFFMTCYTDSDAHLHSMREMTRLLVEHTDGLPIFRNYIGGEGEGVLGGVALDFTEHCRQAGEKVNEILTNPEGAEYGLVLQCPSRCLFDYSLASSFGISMDRLPEDTIFVNRPETFYERYRSLLAPAIMILMAMILLFIAVEISNRVSHRAAHELRVSVEALERSQETIRQRAEYDDFLNILNRRTITEHLQEEYAGDKVYSVVMADMDNFQSINEDYGHRVADEILKYMTDLLKELCAKNGWQIGRYGGDEYLFIIPGEQLTPRDVSVQMLLTVFRMPVPAGDREARLTASLGISASDGVTKPEQHIVNAEIAMYEAKEKGRDRAILFGDDMKDKMREENRIKAKLDEALENDGFFMVYQPQIDAKTLEVSGFEALVRMREPGIYPGQFIPVAEQNGWIWRIGRITTRLVVEQLAAWRDAGHTLHPVSINYSSNQMADTGYLEYLESLLKKYDISPDYIEIEITEGVFLDRTAQAGNLFNRFKELGIRLLMDDFGTGYSSLGYLTYIPVDVIKLDKSLVDAYLVDGKDSFVRDVILLVHDLGKEMIIEGVEEAWQYERLRDFGADTIQGYYFSKPLPPEEAIQFKAK